MKIVQALKRVKHLTRKIEKTNQRLAKWCSYVDDTNQPIEPTYSAEDIVKMHQRINDWATEIARLRHALHVTNVNTVVEYNGKDMSVDSLLLLKDIIIPARLAALTQMRRKEKGWDSPEYYRSVMQFDPTARDKSIDALDNELMELDALLDQITMEVDLIE